MRHVLKPLACAGLQLRRSLPVSISSRYSEGHFIELDDHAERLVAIFFPAPLIKFIILNNPGLPIRASPSQHTCLIDHVNLLLVVKRQIPKLFSIPLKGG